MSNCRYILTEHLILSPKVPFYIYIASCVIGDPLKIEPFVRSQMVG